MTVSLLPALVVLLVLSAAPALSQETRFTDLVGKPCRFLQADPRPGEVKLCTGLSGISPETVAEETRTRFGLRFGSEPVRPLLTAWSFGTKLEWRGTYTQAGFEPRGVILRVLLKDLDSTKPTADGQVLAIIQIDRPRRQACIVRVLDAGRPDANALARETADQLGPTFRCGVDRPSVIGEATRWTAAVLEGAR
jgi:hypothetical protein